MRKYALGPPPGKGMVEERFYGDEAVAFFEFFAQAPQDFEERALAIVATGEPSSARRAARLLQAYELLYWDTLAHGLH